MSLSQYYSKYKESVNASQFISVFKKGSIREVFPGQYLDVTLERIEADAHRGIKAAQTAKKLLLNREYNKDEKR